MSPVVAIIDPDTNITSHVEQVLSAQGLRPAVLADGDVMEFVKSREPSLIVLSVELASGSGYSICNRLKGKRSEFKDIPLILTSSQATQEAFQTHQRSRTPADAYLHKPFSMEDLIGAAQSLVPGFTSGQMPPLSAEAPPELSQEAPPLPAAGAPDDGASQTGAPVSAEGAPAGGPPPALAAQPPSGWRRRRRRRPQPR